MSLIKGGVTTDNIEKICITCLEEKPLLVPFSYTIRFKNINITSITVTNILKKVLKQTETIDKFHNPLICLECLDELQTAYLFILRYEEADTILAKFFSMCAKTEQFDHDYACEWEDAQVESDQDTEAHTNEKITIITKSESETDEQSSNKQISDELSKESGKGLKAQSSKNISKSGLDKPSSNKNISPEQIANITRLIKTETEERDISSKEVSDKISNAPDKDQTHRLHTCPICWKEFTALELRDHAYTHKALNKYLNIPAYNKVLPATKFKTKRHLVDQQVTIFKRPQKIHKCPYCNLEFTTKEFQTHTYTHKEQSEFKCDKCERVFKRINHLNTHRVSHLKEYPFKCEHCDRGFVIRGNYECHLLTHTDDELPHACTYCPKRFSNPQHLHRHLTIHTENIAYRSKYPVFRCQRCFGTFKDAEELKVHRLSCKSGKVPKKNKKIDNTIDKGFPCKICNKVFKSQNGLYIHNKKIHKESKVLCSICGKSVKNLAMHLMNHKGPPGFLCSICGKYAINIYSHMRTHKAEKRFTCKQCDKKFLSNAQLRRHLLVHSGQKPYVCGVCGKEFNHLYNFQVHERIHKGDRCHICVICGKGFLEKSYLKKHMGVHEKV